MPLTSKGKKIMEAMTRTYQGDTKKAEAVFWGMVDKRKLTGVEEIDNKYGNNRPEARKRDGKGRKKKDG